MEGPRDGEAWPLPSPRSPGSAGRRGLATERVQRTPPGAQPPQAQRRRIANNVARQLQFGVEAAEPPGDDAQPPPAPPPASAGGIQPPSVPGVHGGVAPAAARLPAPPHARGPIAWQLTRQGRRGKAATCRGCCKAFALDEVRLSRQYDRAGRHLHLHCIPGGLHAQDTCQGAGLEEDTAIAAAIDAARAPDEVEAMPVDEAAVDRMADIAPLSGPAWWRAWRWEDASRLHGATLIDVPSTHRAVYSDLKDSFLEAVLADAASAEDLEDAWKMLSLVDALVLNSRRAPDESQSAALMRRLQQATDGEWESLWLEATERDPLLGSSSPSLSTTAKRVEALAMAGQQRRALRAMQPPREAVKDPARLDELQRLYPQAAPAQAAAPAPQPWTHTRKAKLEEEIRKLLRKPEKRAAPGPLGSRPEHWAVLRFSPGGLDRAARVLARLALGEVPPSARRVHAIGEIIAIAGPDGGIKRPLLMSSVPRRIALAGVARVLRPEVQEAVGPYQLGVGAPDGAARAFHALEVHARAHPGRAVLAMDVQGAHQSISRPYASKAAARRCPALQLPFDTWYGEPVDHLWRCADGSVRRIRAATGVDQGDPIASQAFAVTAAEPAEHLLAALRVRDPEAMLYQYADDTHLWIDHRLLDEAAQATVSAFAAAGCRINHAKTKVWLPDAATPLPTAWVPKRVASLRCLGARLFKESDATLPATPSLGDAADDLPEAGTRVVALAARGVALHEAGLPLQIVQSLVRLAAQGAPQHALMMRLASLAAVEQYDCHLRAAWSALVGCTLSDAAWQRAQLPLRAGGLAAGAVGPRAAAAYAAAWGRTAPFVAQATGHQGCVADLLSADPCLSSRLAAAAEDLVSRGVRPAAVPWRHGVAPQRPVRQARLVQDISKAQRDAVLSPLPDVAAGRLRSAGGPGAAACFLTPAAPDHLIEDRLFRLVLARRLGGGLRVRHDAAAQGPPPPPRPCAHVGRNGACGQTLDEDSHHSAVCQVGGGPTARHDRLARWLRGWLADGRVDGEVLLEQVVSDPPGRLDVVFADSGRRIWVDVAIPSVTSGCPRTARARARTDGLAARAEEQHKRRKYRGLAHPFVIEALGRPGAAARSLLTRFASEDEGSRSEDVAAAWQAISAIVQSAGAHAEFTAFGGVAAAGAVELFVP